MIWRELMEAYYIIQKHDKINHFLARVSISNSVIGKSLLSAFGNGFAPAKIFNAVPEPPFSAALNSAF